MLLNKLLKIQEKQTHTPLLPLRKNVTQHSLATITAANTTLFYVICPLNNALQIGLS